MNSEEHALQQIAQIIENANNLEMRVGLTLSKCLEPVTPDYGFLRELIFHNTVLSFGSKIQLLERITDYWSWNDIRKHLGRFKELIKLRNAFAHTSIAKRQLLIYFSPDDEFGVPSGSEFIVEKKTPTSWENIERNKAFDAFNKLHEKCIDLLKQIDRKVKETIAQQPTPEKSPKV